VYQLIVLSKTKSLRKPNRQLIERMKSVKKGGLNSRRKEGWKSRKTCRGQRTVLGESRGQCSKKRKIA